METLQQERSQISRIGFALTIMALVGSVLQLALMWLMESVLKVDIYESWLLWLVTFAPIYLAAMPVCLLILKNMPRVRFRQQKLGGKNFWVLLLACFPLMYAGSFIGNLLSMLFSGGAAENALNSYAMDNHPLKILVMVILAPILEEYIFRKQIIDRTVHLNERSAIFFSAATFALFHLNLYQFFYAFAIGLVLAYVYIRTGRLRYSILMHAIVNFMGSVVAPLVLSMVDINAIDAMNADPEMLMELYGTMLPGLAVLMAYELLFLGLIAAGIICIITHWRKIVLLPDPRILPRGRKFTSFYLNPGMLIYILVCVAAMVFALF